MSNKGVGVMSEENNQKLALVPRLRFPEFWKMWVNAPMFNLYSFKGNNSLSRDKLNYEAGELKNIHYGDIHKKFSLYFCADAESVPYINADESSSAIRPENYCRTGDMVFADASEDMADIGKAIEIIDAGDVPLVSGLHTILARPNDGSFALGFCAYLFSSECVRRQIQREGQGAKVLGLSATRLGSVRLYYPSELEEQQKIADCLSSLDELIAAEIQKLDALKTHKKGLMQQLFPREGETVPRLRFPEFANEGEWVAKPLGAFCEVSDIDHKMPPSVATGIPYVMTGDFFGTNGIDFERAKKISIQDYERLSKKIKTELGDIVIARYASVGAVRYIETDIKFVVSYSCATIKCNKFENSQFLYYLLQSDALQSKIGLEVNMSSQKNIGIDAIKKLTAILPNLPEQQKIAASFADLDALIVTETKKLEAIKTHKKGLMQQLFPALNEVPA